MLDVIRQAFDNVDAVLDGTNVLIIVFSMMAACVVRAGTGSTPLTLLLLPGLVAGAWTALYLVQTQGVRIAGERDVDLLVAIAAGEAFAAVVLMIAVRLVRSLWSEPDVTSVRR
jgi:hypothetical protein